MITDIILNFQLKLNRLHKFITIIQKSSKVKTKCLRKYAFDSKEINKEMLKQTLFFGDIKSDFPLWVLETT